MNFADLQTELASWLGANATRLPTSQRASIINFVIRELFRAADLRYNEKSDVVALVAATASYALPSTWSRPVRTWYASPTPEDVVELEWKNKDEFDGMFPDATDTGDPSHYTVWGNLLYVGPTPDAALTLNLQFYEVPADLTGSLEPDLLKYAWDVVLFGALAYASQFMIEDERAPMWQAEFSKRRLQLVTEHARSRSSGRRPVMVEQH